MSRGVFILLIPIMAVVIFLVKNPPSIGAQQATREQRIRLNDGRTVVCLTVYNGGISCDWDRAR